MRDFQKTLFLRIEGHTLLASDLQTNKEKIRKFLSESGLEDKAAELGILSVNLCDVILKIVENYLLGDKPNEGKQGDF
jgi:hypothetical protein